jgi:hypothetical protein
MSRHTPGPWVARPISFSSGVFETQGFAIDFNEDQEQVVDFVYEQADADLICAAPDLLADLRVAAETLRRYESLHRAKGTDDGVQKAEANRLLAMRFEATIAKASGGAD